MRLITNKKFFLSSVLLVLCLFVYDYLVIESISDSIKKYYYEEYLRILLYFSISVAVSSGVLIFFNNVIFEKWLKKIISWYLPFAAIITSTGSEGSFINPGKDDLALFFSWLLLGVTLLFILVQKFYFKVK
ncbi:MAG: hypothetical protein V4606_04490 [Patescibacteria group bacterium]